MATIPRFRHLFLAHWLRDSLDSLSPHYQPEGQHINIRALIGLYETGQKVDDTEEIWITNGQVVPKEEAFNATGWALVEVHSSNSLADVIST